MKQIGFVGLGIMGLPMATNLIKKSGLALSGFDVMPGRRALLAQAGGQPVETAAELYPTSDVLFLCLPSNELLQATVEELLHTARPGTVVVDLGSTSPGIIRALYPKAAEKGIHLIDSPVSGGESGAVAGTLVLMSGGDRAVFDQVQPLLLCMGTSATYMGPSGCGSVAKLANNMIVACNLASIGEAFAFAVKAGLDPTALFDAIKDGYAGSTVMRIKIPKIISRDYSPSARTAVHLKDLTNAVGLAGEMGVEIPMSSLVLDYMNQLKEMGKVDEDHCAVARIYERDMGVDIK